MIYGHTSKNAYTEEKQVPANKTYMPRYIKMSTRCRYAALYPILRPTNVSVQCVVQKLEHMTNNTNHATCYNHALCVCV